MGVASGNGSMQLAATNLETEEIGCGSGRAANTCLRIRACLALAAGDTCIPRVPLARKLRDKKKVTHGKKKGRAFG